MNGRSAGRQHGCVRCMSLTKVIMGDLYIFSSFVVSYIDRNVSMRQFGCNSSRQCCHCSAIVTVTVIVAITLYFLGW